MRLTIAIWLRHLDTEVADAAELVDGRLGVVQGLAVPALLVLDG
jgi:hypothetical protein